MRYIYHVAFSCNMLKRTNVAVIKALHINANSTSYLRYRDNMYTPSSKIGMDGGGGGGGGVHGSVNVL